MAFVKENIFYVEFSKKYNMYLIKNKVFKGTLNMKVIENITEITGEDFNIFLGKIENTDALSLSILIIESIRVLDPNLLENDIVKFFDFDFAIEFINKLLKKCMPQNSDQETNNSIFEDEEERQPQKWDLEHMEYIWYTVLNRKNDFENITPKKYFNQIMIHLNLNKREEAQIKEI